MNCQQTERLLPLYAGGELEEKRAGLVMAHLQSCANCAGAADEYRETRQLVQKFDPPAFGEDVYAGIRQRVMQEIEKEPAASPALYEILAGLFRPRLRWAFAAALLAVSVFAIYFIASRRSDQDQLADNRPPANTVENKPANGQRVPPGNQTAGQPTPGVTVIPHRSIPKRQPQRRNYRESSTDRANSMSVSVPDGQSITAGVSSKTPDRQTVDSGPSEKTLRMEIQTKDPNIRIIWFSQHGT